MVSVAVVFGQVFVPDADASACAFATTTGAQDAFGLFEYC